MTTPAMPRSVPHPLGKLATWIDGVVDTSAVAHEARVDRQYRVQAGAYPFSDRRELQTELTAEPLP